MDLVELLNIVNTGLGEGKSLTVIAKEFGKNESTIRKKLNNSGYKREGNKFVLKEDITCNITKEIPNITRNITPVQKEKKKEIVEDPKELKDIDVEKLNLLLNNLDNILKLIPSSDITRNITSDMRSGINNVISLRADTGLYKLIKEKAKRDNVNISDIVNRALEDYLNNYL